MTSQNNALYEKTLQINTFECDIHGNWKPAAFFQHLTESAGVHATRLGVGFDAMYAQNLFWVHSRMKIKFYRFPHIGDTITIRTWPKTIQQKLFFIRDFEVVDLSGERLAAATSAWLIIDTATRRMVPPKSFVLALPQLSDRAGLDEPLERLGLAKDGEECLRVRAAYSAIDIVGHVNNSRYVEWICDSFPLEMFNQHTLDWMQINYDHELLPGEEVSVRANSLEQDASLWAVEGVNISTATRIFEAAVHWREIHPA